MVPAERYQTLVNCVVGKRESLSEVTHCLVKGVELEDKGFEGTHRLVLNSEAHEESGVTSGVRATVRMGRPSVIMV